MWPGLTRVISLLSDIRDLLIEQNDLLRQSRQLPAVSRQLKSQTQPTQETQQKIPPITRQYTDKDVTVLTRSRQAEIDQARRDRIHAPWRNTQTQTQTQQTQQEPEIDQDPADLPPGA